ncbi:putative polyketide synthase [Whalleya microplaca]|nr:putative polyketide synthase [Whalleya microplaca]
MRRDKSAASSTSGSEWWEWSSSISRASSVATSDMPPSDATVIVGMACRVPGARNTSQLWDMLSQKTDVRRKMPADRFNVDAFYHPNDANKGTTNTKYGYYLDQDLGHFDNEFFHISGAEAEAMDPQQRLLLEVVYEALENAGLTLEDISGSQTAVYCGSFSNDYNLMTARDTDQYPKHAMSGLGDAILSNRISYFYNLRGPSVTVDTACSSSLVCLHLGCQALQSNECEISIVAGSALHFDPSLFVTMSDFGIFSAEGRSRTFDAAGTGYARGEGVTVVVLKRKSDAERMGDHISAVVCATGAGHDGTKSGLTLPNGDSQADLISQTLKKAGLTPSDVDYFEAHGTGTKVGDPIEAKAIGSVFSPGRKSPLIVGSIKSNVGHLEGASGLAGVIKAALSVELGKILPNMHFNQVNPEIDLKALKLQVPTEVMDWPRKHAPRRAAINSFGYGGSNAHVILESYQSRGRLKGLQPRILNSMPTKRRPYLVVVTSHSKKAASLLTNDLCGYFDRHKEISVSDLAQCLNTRRTMHRYRSFAIGYDAETITHDMRAPKAQAKWTKSNGSKPRLGFVFTGQGAQWNGMGRQLIELSPMFRYTLERCDQVLQGLPDSPAWSCVDELLLPEENSRMNQSKISQPVCAALQLAIVDLFRAWGINPAAVVGHSSGEIAAAYAAGILSFENAIICAYYRGLYMSKGAENGQSPAGAMVAVGLSMADGLAELKPYAGRIVLAAVNSPSSLTFSGDKDAVLELARSLAEQGTFVRQLRVEQAFHSHHMVPLAFGFEQALSNCTGFEARNAHCQMHSSVTARDSSTRKMDANYWSANMTGMVRFSDALTGILLDDDDEQNIDMLVEIGPHPVLQTPSREVLKALGMEVPYIASLTRQAPSYEDLLAAAGQLFARGYPLDLLAVNSANSQDSYSREQVRTSCRRLRDLPTYSWDHSNRFWADTRLTREHRFRQHRHSLLGAPVPGAPGNRPRWRSFLRLSELPWLSQHVVDDKVVFPAAGYVSMAIEAVTSRIPEYKSIELRDVVFKSALVLSESVSGVEVMLELEPSATSAKSTSNRWSRFTFFSFDADDKTVEHSHGLISVTAGEPSPVETLKPQDGLKERHVLADRRQSKQAYYRKLCKNGLQYGEDFRLISGDIASGRGSSTAPLRFNPANVVDVETARCVLHPTLFDASFHPIFAAIEDLLGRALSEIYVPSFLASMSVSGVLNQQKHSAKEVDFWVKSETKLPGPRVAISDLSVQSDATDDVLFSIRSLEVTALGEDPSSDGEAARCLFFQWRWQSAFEQFGRDVSETPFLHLAGIVDIFSHQFPDARILHVTDDLSSVKEAMQMLGGNQGSRRRFRSITPYSKAAVEFKSSEVEFEKGQLGLVDFEPPTANDFDLIITEEPIDTKLLSFLKESGYLVTTSGRGGSGSDTSVAGLRGVFTGERFSAWQKNSASSDTSDKPITILVSQTCLPRTRSLLSQLRATYRGRTTVRTLSELESNPIEDQNIVSLVSLDEDLFWDLDVANSAQFHALQALLTSTGKNITWLTSDATHEASNPGQAIMTGLLRTLRNENENINVTCLDLPVDYAVEDASKEVSSMLLQLYSGDEVALRGGLLRIPRIEIDESRNQKLPNGAGRQARLEPFHQEGRRRLALKIGKVGLLDTLAFEDDEDVADPELYDDYIEVEVKASALNFRDIAASMGLIEDYRLGDEVAGVVLRTGRNVQESEFKRGDRVLVTRPGQGGHRSIVRETTILCHKIGDMDYAEAVALCGVFFTAYFSLVFTARIEAGEYCLIHSAAGGVGQMAVQIAQNIGAKVIATVGSKEKRQFLRERFGIPDHMIFSSRDSSFASGVMAITNGRGVDVALNSLAGELLHETWRSIAPFGRLVEIGKRDIHENTKLDMDPFRRNVTYASVDLITLYHHNKPMLARLADIMFGLVTEGKMTPPQPLTRMSFAEVQKAFRLLQMGKHFGKVVLLPGKNDMVPVLPPSYHNTTLFSPEKVYLLVGGLGGLGQSLSGWMVRRGARRFAFLSRSGDRSERAQATLSWLRAKGVEATVFRGDVTNRETVDFVIEALGDCLAGIFQAVMVLRDSPYSRMTMQQWRECANPKTQGTWNLHNATLNNSALDFFVCFSSSSGALGAMAQANYAAGNCYMDALMAHRRAMGLPGFTMNLGMVTGVGAVSEDTALETTMERLGYEAMTEEELFYQTEEAILASYAHREQQKTIGPQQKTTWAYTGIESHGLIAGINVRRKDVYWATLPTVRNLYANLDLGCQGSKARTSQDLASAIRRAQTHEEKMQLLTAAFLDKVASVLSVPVDSLQPENPLSNYGLDSIVAVEFRKWFFKETKADVALFQIIGAKSITALLDTVVRSAITALSSPSTEGSGGQSAEPAANTYSNIQTMQHQQRPEKLAAARISTAEFPVVEDRSAPIALSSAQNGLWRAHSMLQDPSVLNLTITCFISGEMHFQTVQQAFVELARRNPIFRTAYLNSVDDSSPAQQQILETFNPAAVRYEDVSDSAGASPRVIVEQCADKMKRVTLDIHKGEVMHATVLKLGRARYAVAFAVHHIALDNMSTASMVGQMINIYDALRFGTQADLDRVPSPRLTYSDYTLWMQQQVRGAGSSISADLEWWATRLRGVPAASALLPFAAGPRPAQLSSVHRDVLHNTLSASLFKRMKRVASGPGAAPATPFHFLLAALRAFLHRYTREDDVVLLLVDDMRPHPALDDVIGDFVNLVPLRCTGGCDGPDATFDSLLSSVSAGVLEAMAHGRAPFDHVIRAAGAEPNNRSHFPLGQIIVNYMPQSPAPRFAGREFRIDDLHVSDMAGTCELAVDAIENSEGVLGMRLEFDCGLYSRRHMERFWDNFLIFLTQVIRDHRTPLAEVKI